jgi:hypothetical protein
MKPVQKERIQMTLKRLLMPMLVVGIVFTMSSMAHAQAVTCSITSTGLAIGAVPALLGPTPAASNTGLTEVTSVGPTGIPTDGPGTGRVRISCTNANPAAPTGPSTAVNPGVVALTVGFGNTITNSTTHPPGGAGIRIANGTGDFVTGTNVSINSTSNTGGTVVLALGTPTGTPTAGITFSGGPGPTTSTFELGGVLLSTTGKSGAVTASLTSSGGVSVVPTVGACTSGPGPCTVVITNVQESLVDPVVAVGSLPSSVTSQTNLGTTPIAGGAAVINSAGGAVKSNFTIRIQENYASMYQSAAQFNGGAVFPASSASSVQVNIALSNIPSGFDISGCAAVLTDTSGNAPAAPFLGSSPLVSSTNFTAASPVLTVLFGSPVDTNNIDVLWVTCTRVAAGSASLPLPSQSITAQVFLGPTGAALSGTGGVLTGLTNGQIPRYTSKLVPATPITVVVFPPSNTVLLLSFGFVGPGYNTGLAIANTTTDPFTPTGGGAATSSGTVSFFMVKNDGTTKTYTTTTGSPGSGLTGAGVVASGSTYVVNLSELLSAAAFGTTFTGYVFVTANFNFAHGAATIYTTSTGAAALSSPVLVVTNGAGGGVSSAAPRSSPESLGQ